MRAFVVSLLLVSAIAATANAVVKKHEKRGVLGLHGHVGPSVGLGSGSKYLPPLPAPVFSKPHPVYSVSQSYEVPTHVPSLPIPAPVYGPPAIAPSLPVSAPAPVYDVPSFSAPVHVSAPAPVFGVPSVSAPVHVSAPLPVSAPAPVYGVPGPVPSFPVHAPIPVHAPVPVHAPIHVSAPVSVPAPLPISVPAPSYGVPAPVPAVSLSVPAPTFSVPAPVPAPIYSGPSYEVPAPVLSGPAVVAKPVSFAPSSVGLGPSSSYGVPSIVKPLHSADLSFSSVSLPSKSYGLPAAAAHTTGFAKDVSLGSFANSYSAPLPVPSAPSDGYSYPVPSKKLLI